MPKEQLSPQEPPISPADLKATQRVLNSIGVERVLGKEPSVQEIVDAKAKVMGMEPLVQQYHQREIDLQQQLEQMARKLGRYEGERAMRRRDLLRGARNVLVGGIIMAAVGTGGRFVYDQEFSSEAQQRKATEERAANEAFEKNNRLGLDRSITSKQNWAINYALADPNAKYATFLNVQYPTDAVIIIPTGTLNPTGQMGFFDTAVSLTDYRTTQGTNIPEFNVEYEERKFQHYLAQEAERADIDKNHVQFTNLATNTSYFLRFSRLNSSPTKYQIEYSQRVQ